jgi:hypothetical protein
MGERKTYYAGKMPARPRNQFVGDELRRALEGSKDMDDVAYRMVESFRRLREEHNMKRLGYVSGIITSDGPEFMVRNRAILKAFAEHLKGKHDLQIFAPSDVFEEENDYDLVLTDGRTRIARPNDDTVFYMFWRKVLTCGYVTDIFMTPRWKKSKGAMDEHNTAIEAGIRMHYLEDDRELLDILESFQNNKAAGLRMRGND